MKKKKTHIDDCTAFEEMPNVAKATAGDLRLLGFTKPKQLAGKDPWKLYVKLCQLTQARHDPCVVDVFMAVVKFAAGGPAVPWWDYTAERKKIYAAKLATMTLPK